MSQNNQIANTAVGEPENDPTKKRVVTKKSINSADEGEETEEP